ncbi:hypothetical protein DL240_05505 [Lujinxingia litoralis]|uniref:Carbohydrate-binding domain-containing protein n=1 Tax=Lujinxingia litoralis TaxID=2211119 RepID=A0A328C8E8_9DELT|nr:carbohydrate-binding family 9-like protein [Lujinxingia litoralis]RAL23616.1 hypothetical protein DL240_05505 [Lujinxingia litoralis]
MASKPRCFRHSGPWLVSLALATGTLCTACQSSEPRVVLTQEQWSQVREHILEEAPTPKYPIGATYDDTIELIGLDIDGELKAGQEVTFTWYWRALQDVERDWKIFVHFDSQSQPLRQNLDHYPVGDLFRTPLWKEGQIIRDQQTVKLREDFPRGEALPYIGLFRDDVRAEVQGKSITDDRRAIGPRLNIDGVPVDTSTLPRYEVHKLRNEQSETLTLDGKLNEALWSELKALTIEGFNSRAAYESTVKLAYDDTYLYVGAYLQDEHVWATLSGRDASLWTEEVFEFFIAPGGPDAAYVELQFSPRNVVFDALFPHRPGTRSKSRNQDIAAAKPFTMQGLESAAHVEGSLNDEGQKDSFWSVEVRIPLKELPGVDGAPPSGTTWRANLYRFDRPSDDKTFAYGWSTRPRRDFHDVNLFGTLVFVDQSND